ncbi:hypothetical protein SLS62_001322 [Diatrype stigma]|uniref:3-hydroxyacyl-CoA dehydrogenase n=1 Tax=Diatrype stigma TaxID=117547 RepID=A0AAN9VAE1_9PEZI
MTAFTIPNPAGRPLAVLGGGVLGRRIACVWAAGGFDVNIYDPSAEQRASALHYVEASISQYPASAPRGQAGAVRALGDLTAAIQNAWLVVECVPERLPVKHETFEKLEASAPADAILCTNSSSYKSREVAATLRPETRARVLNMHYMMPPKARVVELMTCGETAPEIFPFLFDHLTVLGMKPVVAKKESTGFVINRLWAAVKREVLTILSEGVSDPEELDSVWIEMFGSNRSGPCAMMDAVGLDTVSLIEQHYVEERHLPAENTVGFLKKYLDEGKLGAKSGKGGLLPPGSSTKTAGDVKGNHDNMHAPLLYFLDIGVSQGDYKEAFHAGKVLTGAPDGRPLKTLVDHERAPDGIDISITAGKLFWTSMGIPSQNDGAVFSSNLDGSDIQTVVPRGEVHTPKQICVDHKKSKLYFSDREGLRVMRCDFDGSNREVIVQTGDWQNPADKNDQTRWCVGMTVSQKTGKFYWTQKGPSKGGKGRIFRANIDFLPGENAGNRTDIECLFQNLSEPIDLEIDEKDEVLYWTDRGELPLGNSVNRVSLDKVKVVSDSATTSVPGRDYEMIVRNLHEAIGLKLDPKNRHIYVTDLGGCVYRFTMDGGDKKKFYEGEGAFTGITIAYV